MSKILVTGGAGFIGSHIVDVLLNERHEVHVLDNLSSGSKSNLNAAARFHQLDVRSPEARALLERESFDQVVHAAAQISVRESMRDPHFDVEVNVGGIVNLLTALRNGKQPHLVFISTGGAIYGEQDTFPAPETHKCEPTSIYGLSKRVSEIYLDFWKREFKLNYGVLRLGNIYGPRQNPHGEAGVVAIFCQQLLSGKVPTINGDGGQTRDFVFVGDVADAVRRVLAGKVTGTFNIGTGRETSVNEIFKHLAAELAPDARPNYGPAKEGEQMRSVIDAGLAQRTFGWKPGVTVEQGLRQTARWFAEQAKK